MWRGKNDSIHAATHGLWYNKWLVIYGDLSKNYNDFAKKY